MFKCSACRKTHPSMIQMPQAVFEQNQRAPVLPGRPPPGMYDNTEECSATGKDVVARRDDYFWSTGN